MTYAELQAAVLAECGLATLAAEVPAFIRRAEGMIAREVRAKEMVVTGTMNDANRPNTTFSTYSLPLEFLEERAFFFGTTPLVKRSPIAIAGYDSSDPVHSYSVRGGDPNGPYQVEFRGTPAAGSTLTVIYFARPTALANASDTTPLLLMHEELYIQGALWALYKRTQDLELAQAALDAFKDTREALNEQCGRFLGGGTVDIGYNLGNFKIGEQM